MKHNKRKDTVVFIIAGLLVIILAIMTPSKRLVDSITTKSNTNHTLVIDNNIIKVHEDSLRNNPELGKAIEILKIRLGYKLILTIN